MFKDFERVTEQQGTKVTVNVKLSNGISFMAKCWLSWIIHTDKGIV